MYWTSEHMNWLRDTGERLKTVDGKTVRILEFCPGNDDRIISLWARHFRNHYCRDCDIDFLRNGTGYTRAEYLNNIKFPDKTTAPGPSIRSGDFGEVLIADYLEFVLKYWVPRTRYNDKVIRNESSKGCDIIGFRFSIDGKTSIEDSLVIIEAKAQLTGITPNPRLQNAVDDSGKDLARKGESLNAIKQRFFFENRIEVALKVERFQDPVDRPYREYFGAAALFSSHLYSSKVIQSTNTSTHPNFEKLFLIVIRGDSLMDLVHELYRRAADDADKA